MKTKVTLPLRVDGTEVLNGQYWIVGSDGALHIDDKKGDTVATFAAGSWHVIGFGVGQRLFSGDGRSVNGGPF
jgi:hypothetical protein